MNKDLLMLCIAFYSGLEILLIQSSTSQICVFVDPWKLQTSPNIYCCNNTAAKSDWFAAVLQQHVSVLQVAKVFLHSNILHYNYKKNGTRFRIFSCSVLIIYSFQLICIWCISNCGSIVENWFWVIFFQYQIHLHLPYDSFFSIILWFLHFKLFNGSSSTINRSHPMAQSEIVLPNWNISLV